MYCRHNFRSLHLKKLLWQERLKHVSRIRTVFFQFPNTRCDAFFAACQAYVRTYNYTIVSLHCGSPEQTDSELILFTICRDDWYGLLFSQTSSSKKANLVLGVFYPRASLSWLGQFQYLGNRPENAVDPRLQSEEKAPMFPLPPPRPHSFQSPNNFFWAEEGVLQVYFTV